MTDKPNCEHGKPGGTYCKKCHPLMTVERLTDLSTIPPHMRMDYKIRNQNIVDKKKLCKRCGGTGNQLLSMYQACTRCKGKGHI